MPKTIYFNSLQDVFYIKGSNNDKKWYDYNKYQEIEIDYKY